MKEKEKIDQKGLKITSQAEKEERMKPAKRSGKSETFAFSFFSFFYHFWRERQKRDRKRVAQYCCKGMRTDLCARNFYSLKPMNGGHIVKFYLNL